jgi:hypothetical protein
MIFKSLYPDVTIPEVALTSFVLQLGRLRSRTLAPRGEYGTSQRVGA